MSENINDKIFSDKDKKKLKRNIGVLFVMVVLAFLILLFPDFKKEKEPVHSEFSDIERICELSTLRCYYHNVAEYEKDPDGLFQYGLFQYGYKKFWMEYTGIVEVGVDAGALDVSEPDENGVVSVYVPEAKILNVDADESSMTKPLVDKGVFTTITTEDKIKAYSKAQDTMKENAKTDTNILKQAHQNAKKLIEEYIVNSGELVGQKYTVKWHDKPLDNKE